MRARSISYYLFLAIVFTLFSAWISWSVMVYMDRSSRSFDSGWVAADNSTDRVIRFEHGLGVVPTELSVWFSPTADGATAYPLQWRWYINDAGNPVTMSANRQAVVLAIYRGAPLFGAWTPSTWTTYTKGFFRVIAR